MSGWVILFNAVKSPQILNEPSALGTSTSAERYCDAERLTMPKRSMSWKAAFAAAKLEGDNRRVLATGGSMGEDLMCHAMGWLRSELRRCDAGEIRQDLSPRVGSHCNGV